MTHTNVRGVAMAGKSFPLKLCYTEIRARTYKILTPRWNHVSRNELGNLHDDLLRAEILHDDVSFVFQYCSH